jgi:hypothetical protein
MAFSLVRSHAHAHRRLWLRGTSSCVLLALSEACCSKCLPRLGELVDQELFDRQALAPAVLVNPELWELLPF